MFITHSAVIPLTAVPGSSYWLYEYFRPCNEYASENVFLLIGSAYVTFKYLQCGESCPII